MKEYETIKTYRTALKTWTHMVTIDWHGEKREVERTYQLEYPYTEYGADGKVVNRGTEDFSSERAKNLQYYRIFTWDGKRYNKGGQRWFTERCDVRIERKNRKALTEIAKVWYPDAAEISIRA